MHDSIDQTHKLSIYFMLMNMPSEDIVSKLGYFQRTMMCQRILCCSIMDNKCTEYILNECYYTD